jgi:hypothetical protein
MVALRSLTPAPLAEVRQRSGGSSLLALGLRLVLAAALVGVLAGLVEAALWAPSRPAAEPPAEVCPDPPCLPESLPDARHLPLLVPPLGYLLAGLLGAAALLLSLAKGRSRGRRPGLLAVVGPVAVLVATEVVPHVVNPCLAASAAYDRLPSGCSRTVHGVDVHDRVHALHHAVVGGVPAAVGYAALLRRRRPELFQPQDRSSRPVPVP